MAAHIVLPFPLYLPPSPGTKMAAEKVVHTEEEGDRLFMFLALLWLHRGPWGTGMNTFATTEVWTDQPGRDRFGGCSALSLEEEIELEGKLLHAGKSVGVVSVDFRKKRTSKLMVQAHHTKYLAVSSRL